jgi:hypothetical protein
MILLITALFLRDHRAMAGNGDPIQCKIVPFNPDN